MNEIFDYSKMDLILKKNHYDPSNIIAILQQTQDEYRYLPKEAFFYYSQQLKISKAKIFSIATFYENFSLQPKGRYVIKVCDGTACHVRKSIPVLTRLRDELGLSETKVTTDDLLFTVEVVSCLGACGLAPAMIINDKVVGQVTPELVSGMIQELRGKAQNAEE